jgi:hypothetical protein
MEIIKITQTASSIASVAAIIAGALWFVYTSKFKRRIQFDLDCLVFRLRSNPELVIAEIQFIFHNTGFVEHRIHNLFLSIHALKSEKIFIEDGTTHELKFKKCLFPLTSVRPAVFKHYFVRPGVRQLITHIVRLDSPGSIIRVTASFDYDRKGKKTHTARRIFLIPEQSNTIPKHLD